MKKKDNEVRKKWVPVRMNQKEYDAFFSLYNQSTCRSVSEYFRKVVLKKKVTFKHRNESADEILAAFARMKNELNVVGSGLNQAVHKLHLIDRIPEFRNWILSHENLWQMLEKTLTEIKNRMDQIWRDYSKIK